ncbi:hypothetical protein [Nitrososphaera viennensis]|nr:hypothetical protein [Nitrososphaera viennensis]UVS70146.1 hypothetical protein NWT39_04995 [Nitrososphaera viennensis]
MVDEVRLAALVVIVTVAVPVFLITGEAKDLLSGSSLPVPRSAIAMSGDNNSLLSSSSVEQQNFAKDNPEQALYAMYDAQAVEELDRCFSSPEKGMCDGSVDLIVDSCKNSQVDLVVCHDPRIEQLVASKKA